MENITLSSSIRTNLGKGSARTIRRTGLIPATYYREGREPTLITINPRLLQLSFDKSGNPNHLVDIEIDGKVSATCLVKDVQRHPVTGNIRHVDFYQVEKDEVITISVPIEIVGKSIGVQMGGALRTIRRTVDVTCKPGDIPATIQLDVTNLEAGKFFKVSEVKPPSGVEIMFSSDFNLVTVIKKRIK
jgi:large subunit ribosomal protein L25